MKMIRIAGVLSLLAAFSVPAEAENVPDQDKAWHHVREVLLAAEHGVTNWRVQKWAESPGYLIMGGSDGDAAVAREVIGEINEVLDGTAIELGETDIENALIRLVFAPRDDFGRVAAENGFGYADGGVGYTATWADQRNQIRAALVIVATDLGETERRATIVQEICHALGLLGHAPYFPASALYRNGQESSSATELAPIDRRLLRFLYANVWSGSREGVLHWAFDKYWHAEE